MSEKRVKSLSKELKKELQELCRLGTMLVYALEYKHRHEESKQQLDDLEANAADDEQREQVKEMHEEIRKLSLDFPNRYENWYSKASHVIGQILPDRLSDFRIQYERPRAARKEITYSNYVIQDALRGITLSRYGDTIVSPASAVSNINTQVAILRSCLDKFESRLFELRALVQADLFDSEIEAAKVLCKNGFLRAAGAMAGVVLEAHLADVASNHSVKTRKKHPTISTWNDALKEEGVLPVDKWRFIQRLGDLRNLCDHKKERDPTEEDIQELLDGVDKVIKIVF